MTALTHLDATPRQTTVDVDSTRVGSGSASMKPEHQVGNTVDKVDQLSSVTLMGMAIGGSAVMLTALWLIH